MIHLIEEALQILPCCFQPWKSSEYLNFQLFPTVSSSSKRNQKKMSQKLLKKCLVSTVRLPLRVLGSVAPPRHHVVEVPPFASATHPANRSRGSFFILEDGRWQLRFQCKLSATVGKSWGDVDFWQCILPKPSSTFPKQTGGWMIASS